MEADERFQAICFVVMIILEIILIIMLVSKIRRELKYAGTNRRMTAMVESVRKTRISSKRYKLVAFDVLKMEFS